MTTASVVLARRVRPVAGTLAGMLSLGAVVAGAWAFALAAAAGDHGFLVPALISRSAGWVQGPLAGVAGQVPLSAAVDDLALMGAGYLGALALGRHLDLRALAAAVLVAHVAMALAPPVLSTDVFSYVDAARLEAVHHLDPYTAPPVAAAHDAVFGFVHWHHVGDVYGPAFVLGTWPLGLLSPAAALWTLKGVAAAASLGCTALVGWIARHRSLPVAPAVAAFGLNPLLLVWTVGGAHNDVLMLLGLVAGVALVLVRREIAGGAALIAAVAVKASAGLAMPFIVLGARRPLRVLAGVAAAGVLLAALSYAAFPDHALTMLTTLRRQQLLQGFGAEPVEVAQWLGVGVAGPHELLVLKGLRVAAVLVALVWVLRGGDGPTAAGWVLLAVVATSTWELGWYTVWPLAFAAVSPSRRLLVATCGLQLAYAATHLPFR